MKVWAWRLAVAATILAIWEAVAAPLNPLFYIRPSALPAALAAPAASAAKNKSTMVLVDKHWWGFHWVKVAP